ncbi:NnrS family protein [Neopusillimonas aromaticivorans]|nr:NnrS family protein [Neopusillimonas aromaticivorans]WJJ92896.1 NnrS family protein [Neopusillimonas aromaticivorans]
MAELHPINEPHEPPRAPSFSALFSLGFRPLYIGGMAWGLVTIFIWVFVPDLISPQLGPLAWHAHEMLWGFIATIAVGFLLTAAATWTGANPVQGRALATLCGLWLVARLAYSAPGTAMLVLAVLAETLFLLLAALALWRVIQQAKSHRNYGLPWLLLGLAIANLMFVNTAHEGNYNALMAAFQIGLIDMAVIALLVARRVIPFFAMRAIQGLTLPMHTGSGQIQLALGLLAIITGLLGLPALSGSALLLTGFIGLYQLQGWKPWRSGIAPSCGFYMSAMPCWPRA